MADWIIILGGRSAAVDAALSLGLQVFLIAETKTPKRVFNKAHKSLALSLRMPFEDLLVRVTSSLAGDKPQAIIAVSEQGVFPAAQLREYFRLPGQNVESAKSALIKSAMKQRFIQAGLPCWPTQAIETVEEAVSLAETFGYPLVVKALASSGSRGFRIIHDRARLRRVVKSMLLQTDYGGVGMEPFCQANECSVELVIQQGNILLSNITDYLVPAKSNLLPAKFSTSFTEKLLKLAAAVVAAFEFSCGMVHIEFYYRNEELWIGEINARPPGGGLMDLIARAYQVNPWQLVIQAQLANIYPVQNIARKRYAANWIIHPGKGKVQAIKGTDFVSSHPLTEQFKLKLSVGQQVLRREGTGESVGSLTMCSGNHQTLVKAMTESMQQLTIDMQPCAN